MQQCNVNNVILFCFCLLFLFFSFAKDTNFWIRYAWTTNKTMHKTFVHKTKLLNAYRNRVYATCWSALFIQPHAYGKAACYILGNFVQSVWHFCRSLELGPNNYRFRTNCTLGTVWWYIIALCIPCSGHSDIEFQFFDKFHAIDDNSITGPASRWNR